MSALPSYSARSLARHWNGRLASYRLHRNDEHLEALVAEALRYVGLRLESRLAESAYWAKAPLARRVAVLLYLVDRGAVIRNVRRQRTSFEAIPGAEEWARAQVALEPYLGPTLAFLDAIRREQAGATPSAD